MAILYFSDVLRKVGLDPARVKLIRHSLRDKGFKKCYDENLVYEYTCHQKNNFSKGYDYWVVFVSDSSTFAKLHSILQIVTVTGQQGHNSRPVKDLIPGQKMS